MIDDECFTRASQWSVGCFNKMSKNKETKATKIIIAKHPETLGVMWPADIYHARPLPTIEPRLALIQFFFSLKKEHQSKLPTHQFEQTLHGFSANLKILSRSLCFLFPGYGFHCWTFLNSIKRLAVRHQQKHARFGNTASVMCRWLRSVVISRTAC